MNMRNSLILIDQIDRDPAVGMPPWEAVIESSVRPPRPVILTAVTAILVMIPLTHSVFWGGRWQSPSWAGWRWLPS